ncbi:flagellar hook-basal body complex protein FliE [Desulfurobacterium sp.]
MMKVENDAVFNVLPAVSDKKLDKKSGFEEIFENFIRDVNNDLKAASEAEKKLMDGNVQNFEELLYTISKSELSLRLLVEIKNKALESYQEIMRMQV